MIASHAYLSDYRQEFEARSITGSRLLVDISDYHGAKFAVLGFFNWRNLSIAKSVIQPGDTIIEIGANIGTESVGFRDLLGPEGELILFEPMPDNIRQLETMVTLNHWENVFIKESAVGEKRGQVSFVLPKDSSMSGIGYVDIGKAACDESNTIQVPIIPLDELLDNLKDVRIIFADTEGHEYSVMKGAEKTIWKFRPVIVLGRVDN